MAEGCAPSRGELAPREISVRYCLGSRNRPETSAKITGAHVDGEGERRRERESERTAGTILVGRPRVISADASCTIVASIVAIIGMPVHRANEYVPAVENRPTVMISPWKRLHRGDLTRGAFIIRALLSRL